MDALFVTQPGGLLPSKRAFAGACEQDALSKRNRNFADVSAPVFNLHATSALSAPAPAAPAVLFSSSPPPPLASSVVAFRLLCPVARSGSVIGRGGDVIGRVRAATRARIKVDMPLTPQCSERVVHLSSAATAPAVVENARSSSAAAASRCPAVDALLAVHDRILRGDAADQGEEAPELVEGEEGEKKSGPEEAEEEEVEARLLVDTSQIGAVLGKGGSIISATRRATGARLRVLPARELPACSAPGDELLQISGTSRSVRAALRLVAEQLRANPPRRAQQQQQVGAAAGAAAGSPAVAAAAVVSAAAAVAGSQQQQQQQQQQYQNHPTAALAAALAVLNDDEEDEEGNNDNDGSDGGSPFLFNRGIPSRHSSSPFFSSPLAGGGGVSQSPFSPFAGEFAPAAAVGSPTAAAAAGHQHQLLQHLPPPPPSPSVAAAADVTFRLLVPARAIGTVIGRGGDVARRLRAESGAWLKVHPVAAAPPPSSPPPEVSASEASAAAASSSSERVVQLSSSCSPSSSSMADFCGSPQSPCPSTPAAAAAAAAAAGLVSTHSASPSSSPLFLNAFSTSFANSASPGCSPSSPLQHEDSALSVPSSSCCPAVSALLACVRLVLADGGGVGARHSVRLLVAGPAALALLKACEASSPAAAAAAAAAGGDFYPSSSSSPLSSPAAAAPSAPEHGSVLSKIAAATGATFRAEAAVSAGASDEGSVPASSSPLPLATATPGDVILTISGAAAPAEAATRALASALVRLQVSEAAARAAARRGAGAANPLSSPASSPSRLGPWRSPVPSPCQQQQQQQQQHLRYDLWESSSAALPQQQQQQYQQFPPSPSPSPAAAADADAVVVVLRLDPHQASAALGRAGANLAAVSAASGAAVRLVDAGNGCGGGGDSSVGLELSGRAAQVESARAVVSAFVLTAGARPL